VTAVESLFDDDDECALSRCAAGFGVTLTKSFADQKASRALCAETVTEKRPITTGIKHRFTIFIEIPQDSPRI
jgi:hypothetical protein